jgi:uncharacterized protein (TIGR02145 family)
MNKVSIKHDRSQVSGVRRKHSQKMNFFRFCQRNLTALTVVLALMACDQLLPTAGTGKLVEVKIRAVSIAGGAQNETITRATGGGSEKRIVGEPVIEDFGGILAKVTVEEDVEALRVSSLAGNVKFRVIAIKHSGQTYLAHADFTVGSSSNPSLYVPDDEYCDFICLSYNSTADLPPASGYAVGSALPALTVSASSPDILWQKNTSLSNRYIVNSDELSFTMSQRFVKVKLILDTSRQNIAISSVGTSIGINAAGAGSFNVAAGSFSGSGTSYFSGWTRPTSYTAESSVIRTIRLGSARSISLPVGSITLSGVTWGAKTVSLPSAFVAGKSYTVRLRLATCGMDGVAIAQKIGNNTYLTHWYGPSTDGSSGCWMVQNSMEGTPSATEYGPDRTTGEYHSGVGYYYTHEQATGGACPSGWHLPDRYECQVIVSEVAAAPDRNSGIAKWWLNLDYIVGFYTYPDNGAPRDWAGWRGQGGYRTTEGPKYILLCYATAGIQYASQNVYGYAWWSVRCVKNR